MPDIELTTAKNDDGETVAIMFQQLNLMKGPNVVEANADQLRQALEMVTGCKWCPVIGEIEF